MRPHSELPLAGAGVEDEGVANRELTGRETEDRESRSDAERSSEIVAIGIGSNLGDSATEIERALGRLAADEGGLLGASPKPSIEGIRSAALYRAQPELAAGAPAQAPYTNTAAVGRTRLAPEELLAVFKRLEQLAGRTRGIRWAARPLDLDLLLYGDRVEARPELTLPHPRLAQRAFYLVPLAEIAPGLHVPTTGRTVEELASALPEAERTALQRLPQSRP